MTCDPLLVYGATGYTGRLVVEALRQRGLRPILGGRSAAKLEVLADEYGCEYRVAPLTDLPALRRMLRNVDALLLTAGPMSETAVPMVQACLDAGVHYVDVTGECAVINSLSGFSADAIRRGLMIMPGCGFDVVASDCLACHVARRQPRARQLAIGLSGLVTPTRGSLRTVVEQAGMPVWVRRNGAFATVPPGVLRRRFDYGRGTGWSTAVTWGDVATAYLSTGIPDIDVYFEETPLFPAILLFGQTWGPALQSPLAQWLMKGNTAFFPEGPTATERAIQTCIVVVEATDASGAIVTSRLQTPQSYAVSADAAATVLGRVLRGDFEPGFQTPGRVYGADFVLQLSGVRREDLESGPSCVCA
jgi:short subunit dehydrogenase-like uncharacterized protein